MLFAKFGFIFTMFWVVSWQRFDPDFGWHLQTGRYILAHGVPVHDIYTYTASNFKWINHEWAHDVILAFFYKYPHGWEILATLYAALWTCILFVSGKKASLTLLIIAAFSITPYAGIRPMVYTFLLFALLLKISKIKSWRVKAFIPIMFIFWANLHGGVIIGLLIMLYFTYRDKDLRWLAVLVASLFATFINPYGPALFVEIARTMFDSSLHKHVAEWNQWRFGNSTRLYVVAMSFGYVFFSAGKLLKLAKDFIKHPLRWHKVTDDIVYAPLTLALAASATRNIPLMAITTLDNLDTQMKALRSMIPKKLDRISKLILLSGFLSVVFILVFVAFPITFNNFKYGRERRYPYSAVEYINKNGCGGGNIYNDYDFGGYLILKLPAYKYYIDGRMPSWRNEGGSLYIDKYFEIFKDKEVQKEEFKKYNITCMVVYSQNKSYVDFAKDNNWKTVASDNVSVLMVKQ